MSRPILATKALTKGCVTQILRNRLSTRCFAGDAGQLQELLRNSELNQEDARTELRWIRQAADKASSVLDDATQFDVNDMVKSRGDGIPLQYILGDTDFGPLTLLCKPPTLIPRPETAYCFELLAQSIQESSSTQQALNVVDLCTGSSPIPLLLKHLLGNKVDQCLGVDISTSALELARRNIKYTGLGGVDVWQGSVFEAGFGQSVLDKLGRDANGHRRKLHVLTANPPYIPTDQYRDLPASVRLHEDQGALHSGEDDPRGLRFYRRIAELLPELLDFELGGPRVAVEVGEGQAMDVKSLFAAQGLKRLEAWRDQWDVERLVVGWTR